MRCVMCGVAWFFAASLIAAEPSPTDLLRITCKLVHPKSTATCFLLSRPVPQDSEKHQVLLVTAAHVLEPIDTETATLLCRKTTDSGEYESRPVELTVRKNDQPLWTRHPQQDVAVMVIEPPGDVDLPAVSVNSLATAEDWQQPALVPGELVRCVGFPHAAHFTPDPVHFPLTRLGCLANYPLIPTATRPTFLVSFNTFEGDSGGLIYHRREAEGVSSAKILGLIHGQHFLDEKYDLIYVKGLVRQRLGMSIVVHATVIRETIELVK